MASLRSLSLRRKLPLLVSGLTGGALLVAGALAYLEVRSANREAAEARLQSLSTDMVDLLQASLSSRATLEQTAARSPTIVAALRGTPSDSAALTAELAALRGGGEAGLPVLLVGRDDRTVFTIGEEVASPDPAPDPPLDSVKAFGPFRSVGDRVLFWTSFPVFAPPGQIAGWIAQRRSVVPTQSGGMLASLIGRGIRLSIGQRSDSVWLDLLAATIESRPPVEFGRPYTFARSDGEEVVAVASNLPPTPWVVLMQMPMSQVEARPIAFLRRMGLMGASLILLVVVIAWSATRRLAVPLEDLASAAERMADGDYRRRVRANGDDELARLARSFNTMSEQVARSDEALRHRLNEARALAVRLEEANVSAERAREEAQAASRAKSEFLATMSHELRTPINAVLGYTELLDLGIPGPPTEKQRDYLRRIDRSSRLLISLVDDVLDFSRIESGRMRVEMGIGSTEDAVAAATAALEPEAARKGVTLTTNCAEGYRFRGDLLRVQQILLNLLSNAVKFTGEGGSVNVSCSLDAHGPPEAEDREGSWVRIDVEDTGIGIDPEQIGRVFEPFVQAKVGFTREHGGAGLGLAISRSLAFMMDGDLTAVSERGEGSRFTLWLRGAEAGQPAAASR
jgi:signal transduction histidine kinase